MPELLSVAVRAFAAYEYVRVTSAPGERPFGANGMSVATALICGAYNAEGIGTSVRGYNKRSFAYTSRSEPASPECEAMNSCPRPACLSRSISPSNQ